ncbi:glucosaminidase domain-containing protein [Chryseolinea sp. T2]|uniref:glucosaminidase domain-containing protein n=1 Tax=Chryseolinea sp. T2 TaxID=3129255 RepID=UPI003077BAAE
MLISEYINRFRSFIKLRLRNSGLLPSIVMAHAILESADEQQRVGQSVHAIEYNNDVRIRADRSWKGPKVRLPIRTSSPFAKGRKAWYRIYLSGEQAIGDRIDMLTKKLPLWPSGLFYNDTLKMQAVMLQASGVTNDPGYSEHIVQLVNKHKLYWMDTRWIIQYVFTTVLTISLVRFGIYLLSTYWDVIVPWR